MRVVDKGQDVWVNLGEHASTYLKDFARYNIPMFAKSVFKFVCQRRGGG